jgi:hypothetical protein
MRNIEASPWLEKPRLIEIKAVLVDKRRLNEFSMIASLKRELPSSKEGRRSEDKLSSDHRFQSRSSATFQDLEPQGSWVRGRSSASRDRPARFVPGDPG